MWGFRSSLHFSSCWQVLISHGSLFQRNCAPLENALPPCVTCSVLGISRSTESADRRCRVGLCIEIKSLMCISAGFFKHLKVINNILKEILSFTRSQ